MSDFPDRLRAARERLGLSIEDISGRTRIKAEMLHALERGDVSQLPGAFYTRAFIRTYAREVGLPADELGADFGTAEHHPRQPAVRLEDIPPIKGGSYEAPRAASWQFVPILALVAAAVFFLNARGRTDNVRAPETGAVGTSGPAAPDVVHAMRQKGAPGAAADAMAAATRASATVAERLALQITPSAPVWVTATADGSRVIYRLLNPGERTVVEARDEIALRVGDAGAFVYTINGADGVMLGAPGEVRNVRIRRENFSAFKR